MTEDPAAPRETKPHFLMLDGLRGVAALSVVLVHTWKRPFVVNGQLAVDLFFLLSGFVIAYAYEDRLLRGMPAREFVIRRLVRLYPMILVGALSGMLIALIHIRAHPSAAYPMHSFLLSGLLSLFLVPYLGPNLGPPAFSFNPPLWSLSFEVLANLVYVVFVRRLSVKVLVGIVLFGLVGIGFGGPLGGSLKATILLGFPRIACGFFGGVLLYRLFSRGKVPRINGNFWILSAMLIGLFCYPRVIGGWWFILVYVLLVAVVICGAGARASWADGVYTRLGVVSYPMYLIHWLTLYSFIFMANRVGLRDRDYMVVAIAHFLCLPFIAYIVARWYDMPMRRFLSALLLREGGERGMGGAEREASIV